LRETRADRLESTSCDTLADPPARTKLYAVDPIGTMPARRGPEPAELPPRIHVLNHYHVTNLGTLLDVLA
jgi:hypothetical protein